VPKEADRGGRTPSDHDHTTIGVEPRGDEVYASLTTQFLNRPGTSTSTMMGFPCLRRDGAFFASLEPATRSLILKLPAPRVTQLIEAGAGRAFAPNGRTFREWITLQETDRNLWSTLIEEAWHFVSDPTPS